MWAEVPSSGVSSLSSMPRCLLLQVCEVGSALLISSTGYRLAATTVNGQAVADILEGAHDVEVVDFSGMLRTQQGDQDLSHCLPAAITHNLRSLSLARSGVVCVPQVVGRHSQ